MIINFIRMVFAIAALGNLEVHQIDVKTTFHNEDLDVEIYKKEAKGFFTSGQEKTVYKLVKSFNGLKQVLKQ